MGIVDSVDKRRLVVGMLLLSLRLLQRGGVSSTPLPLRPRIFVPADTGTAGDTAAGDIGATWDAAARNSVAAVPTGAALALAIGTLTQGARPRGLEPVR